MKSKIFLSIILAMALNQLAGQELSITQKLDLMLMQGRYENVIDTCKQIQVYDKTDPAIYFRSGLAYNNMLDGDRSLENFYQAYRLDPYNKIYSFMLAKAYYGKEKYKPAEQLFHQLSSIDSMNWVYASYLTSIYMLYKRYDEAIDIYRRFLKNDSTNYMYLDKIGFASLKKGDHEYATYLYTKSLSLNDKNLTAIKNLAYLYSANRQSDTAIAILTRGIGIDSADMSLYSMRAQLYFSKNYTKRALDDYLVILSSGDSSEINLKRAGIGYCNNLQPQIAINYLMEAYKIDSSDYETCSYLGQSYFNLKEMGRSIYYYKKVINILSPIYKQLGLSYTLLAESQKGNGMYRDAITSFLHAQAINDNPNIYMIIANLYDEQLNDSKNAIKYYQAFLDNIKRTGGTFSAKYLDSIKERLEFLKTDPDK